MARMFLCLMAAADQAPVGEIVFFRSLFAVIPLVAFLWLCWKFLGRLR